MSPFSLFKIDCLLKSMHCPFTLQVEMLIGVCITELNVDVMSIDMSWVNLLDSEEKNGKIDSKNGKDRQFILLAC